MAKSSGAGIDNDADAARLRWDQRYSGTREAIPVAAEVLRDYRHLLPAQGDALDLACGLGGNAWLLAEAGLQAQGWDISAVAVDALNRAVREAGLSVRARQRDVVKAPPDPASFDVIVVSHYLQRDLADALMAALRPGGLLFYQTFTRERVDSSGPRNPGFRLARNELLALFSGLVLRAYREEGALGDVTEGFRNEAMLVGQAAESCRQVGRD